MPELVVKIITSLIAPFATLVVCLINNYFQNRRHMEDMKENERKRTEDINASHSKDMNALKSDIMERVDNVIEAQTELAHSLEIVKMQMVNLREDVSKHNKVIDRTYELERKYSIHEEKFSGIQREMNELEVKLNESKSNGK